MSQLLYNEETYTIIGKCMEVHKTLGHGFLEVVYKDALEIELRHASIQFERERRFQIVYKNTMLSHDYYADFTVFGKIILEAKALEALPEELVSRAINYLKVSGYRLCLLINFGAPSLEVKRIVL